jgi:hypothetical protein
MVPLKGGGGASGGTGRLRGLGRRVAEDKDATRARASVAFGKVWTWRTVALVW